MELKQCIFTHSGCYAVGDKMDGGKPTGIVVHSTGANNKTLKRYVQPIKGDSNYDEVIADIGKNLYGNHWNKASMNACVHAFIGVNASGKVETYQVLPWNICCWGVGKGKKGSYNYNPTARIQFEICEDNLKDEAYFNAVMKEAQELCAYLCKLHGITVDQICSHAEAYKEGYASNHGDCDHWLKKHGKDMNWFRCRVEDMLDEKTVEEIKVGDVVNFSGGYHYTSANGSKGSNVGASLAKVQIVHTGKHPYHVRAVNEKGAYISGVYGWVDANTVSKVEAFEPYLVRVTKTPLNIRQGSGMDYAPVGTIKSPGVYTIVAESSGSGATKWGKLKSGAGWISLDYVKKV